MSVSICDSISIYRAAIILGKYHQFIISVLNFGNNFDSSFQLWFGAMILIYLVGFDLGINFSISYRFWYCTMNSKLSCRSQFWDTISICRVDKWFWAVIRPIISIYHVGFELGFNSNLSCRCCFWEIILIYRFVFDLALWFQFIVLASVWVSISVYHVVYDFALWF